MVEPKRMVQVSSTETNSHWAPIPVDIEGAGGGAGRDGIDGINGIDGLPGGKGDKGDKGDKGEDGTNGTNGRDGIDGINGFDGDQGEPGRPGIHVSPTPPILASGVSILWIDTSNGNISLNLVTGD